MFHKEGYTIIRNVIIAIIIIISVVNIFACCPMITGIVSLVLMVVLVLVLQFFRNPNRTVTNFDPTEILSPCDGKVVVIEETEETEYLKDKRIQVSIFMSPLNVHVNRNPISGLVKYSKYHPGEYLVAWHPKSSTENERTTVVYEAQNGKMILMRQIAGAVARRIVNYLKAGDEVKKGDDMGFIKFGSRVDLYLPLGTEINVKIGDVVKGNRSLIATFKD